MFIFYFIIIKWKRKQRSSSETFLKIPYTSPTNPSQSTPANHLLMNPINVSNSLAPNSRIWNHLSPSKKRIKPLKIFGTNLNRPKKKEGWIKPTPSSKI